MNEAAVEPEVQDQPGIRPAWKPGECATFGIDHVTESGALEWVNTDSGAPGMSLPRRPRHRGRRHGHRP